MRLNGHLERARAAAGRGDERAAAESLRDALALWQGEPLADAAGAFVESARAAAFGTLGTVYAELGRPADAAEQLRRALEMGRRFGQPLGIAMALGNLGLVLAYLNQAFAVYRELADPPAQAVALVSLAEVHCDTGRLVEAADAARTALALAREVGRTRTEASALMMLGRVHAARGEHEAAIEHYRPALELARAGGDRSPELSVLIGLSHAYRHLGAGDQATTLATEAVALAGRWGYRMHEGRARTALAAARLHAGAAGDAVEEATRALALHRETGHRRGEAQTLALLAEEALVRCRPAAPPPVPARRSLRS